MKKETQKAKIERLEQLLANANKTIEIQNKQIDSMVDKEDNSFENSVLYRQMVKQIESLELQLKVSKDSIKHNRDMYISEVKKNDMLIKENMEMKKKLKAGRKEKFSLEQQQQIKQLRFEGKSMNEIAKILNCSKATVFNYLKKFKNE